MGETIRLTAEDGHEMDAYLAGPEGTPKGALVVCQEIFGVNQHMRTVVDRFANAGYLTVAPALFDRVKQGVELGYDQEDKITGRAVRAGVTIDAAVMDVEAGRKAVEAAGKVGVVGYCWGGSVAWMAACRLPVAVAVCYYGGQIHDHRHETPGCPVTMHFGMLDTSIPSENVNEIRAAHPTAEVFLYPAGHGFNCDHRTDFDSLSAEQALERTLNRLAVELD
jgi:carboxymethylenebutenolidase